MRNSLCRALMYGLIGVWGLQYAWGQKTIRQKECWDFDWKFVLNADNGRNRELLLEDKDWTEVQLPHDWSVSLDFDGKLSGCNGHLPGGIGWYRKTFEVSGKDKGKRISVLFDGIYNRSDVYLNGHHLGFRPYGFCYLQYDLTPYIIYGGKNVLAVRVNNPSDNDSIARWYTGSGIYRHAWLVKTAPVHVDEYGTYVTTTLQEGGKAEVSVRTTVANDDAESRGIYVKHSVKDPSGKTVAQSRKGDRLDIPAGGKADDHALLSVDDAQLWSPESPNLYTLYTSVFQGNREIDRYETVFGIRSCEFTADNGFILNGKRVKLKGFCLHQDDASLGAALPLRSMQRKLQIIKEYGVNAIRCSHNQPAPEFLDLCDQMGFIVIDEAFDKWKSGYYAEYFDEWWQRDLRNMIVRDRNHPCVVLWSIGNELQEAWDGSDTGCRRAAMLQDFVHELEPTRQVCLAAQNRHNERFSGVTDVVGYNYLEARMLSDHKKFPERRFLVTEELPYYMGAEGNIRSYDTDNPWNVIAANDFIAGGFIWSGVDYIGEAGWPSHGWPTGLFDICMIEKPRAAFHRAMWNDKPVVGMAVRDNALDIDHGRDLWQWPNMTTMWNFPRSYDGLVVEVVTTTNCEKVVLFQNGNVMGVKKTSDYPNHTIVWNLPYKRGTLVAKGVNGTDTLAVCEMKTAGNPVELHVEADRSELVADGQDLSYVQVELRDENGVLVQHDDRMVTARLEGEGRLIGFINSDLRRTTPFTSRKDKTYFGRAMAIVQTTRQAGDIRLNFEVEGMSRPVTVTLKSVPVEKNAVPSVPSFR